MIQSANFSDEYTSCCSMRNLEMCPKIIGESTSRATGTIGEPHVANTAAHCMFDQFAKFPLPSNRMDMFCMIKWKAFFEKSLVR
jgi:hypothetical protein